MHSYSVSLKNTLNQLSEDLYNGNINWDNLNSEADTTLAQAVDNMNVFSNIDQNLNEFEGLIYDGAYSDHVNKKEKMGLTGENISIEEAEKILKRFIGEEYIEKINEKN